MRIEITCVLNSKDTSCGQEEGYRFALAQSLAMMTVAGDGAEKIDSGQCRVQRTQYNISIEHVQGYKVGLEVCYSSLGSIEK